MATWALDPSERAMVIATEEEYMWRSQNYYGYQHKLHTHHLNNKSSKLHEFVQPLMNFLPFFPTSLVVYFSSFFFVVIPKFALLLSGTKNFPLSNDC